MEAEIIVAGLQQSEAMYGVKYMKVVGDGDSIQYILLYYIVKT